MPKRQRNHVHLAWSEQIDEMEAKLSATPLGKERSDLTQKIRQLQMASDMRDSLSPSLAKAK